MALAGMMDIRGALGAEDNPMAPTPEEMEKEAQAVQFNKKVLLNNFDVRLFDMSKKKDVADYRKLIQQLYHGRLAGTHQLTHFDRQFVQTPTPRWLINLEYVEYKLQVKAVQAVGAPKEKKKD